MVYGLITVYLLRTGYPPFPPRSLESSRCQVFPRKIRRAKELEVKILRTKGVWAGFSPRSPFFVFPSSASAWAIIDWVEGLGQGWMSQGWAVNFSRYQTKSPEG